MMLKPLSSHTTNKIFQSLNYIAVILWGVWGLDKETGRAHDIMLIFRIKLSPKMWIILFQVNAWLQYNECPVNLRFQSTTALNVLEIYCSWEFNSTPSIFCSLTKYLIILRQFSDTKNFFQRILSFTFGLQW